MSGTEQHFNVVILGGGPAGLSASIWCSDLGLSSIVLEKHDQVGGQLHSIHVPIRNYPGVETSNGAELLDRFLGQLRQREFAARTNSEIVRIDLKTKSVEMAGGEILFANALIIATGVRRKDLGVEGEQDFIGRGILETGQTDRHLLENKRLMIVGGGDAALENAAALSEYASKVFLVHRRDSFSAREEFLEKVRGDPRIQIICEAAIQRISGGEHLEGVQYLDLRIGVTHWIEIDGLLIRIGMVPNTELFRDTLELDEKGYIRVDSSGETSARGVFAIGDVACPGSPTISTAVGMGATAAKAIFEQINRQ